MIIFESNDSPFLVLWYLYLVFLAVVLTANIIALILKRFIEWRTNKLLKIPARTTKKTAPHPITVQTDPRKKVITKREKNSQKNTTHTDKQGGES